MVALTGRRNVNERGTLGKHGVYTRKWLDKALQIADRVSTES
jgi:hypothetical protein